MSTEKKSSKPVGRARIPPAPPLPPKGSPRDVPVTLFPELPPEDAIRRIARIPKKS